MGDGRKRAGVAKCAGDGPNAQALTMGSANPSVVFRGQHPQPTYQLTATVWLPSCGGAHGGSNILADFIPQGGFLLDADDQSATNMILKRSHLILASTLSMAVKQRGSGP